MIFVTLGTQDKSFERLLVELDRLLLSMEIKEQVIVQAGHTKYKSKNMQIFDYIEMDQFTSYLEKSDLIITHGGVGSILTSLGLKKKVIAVARLKEFNEHENDHQVEIVSRFQDLGYILGCIEVSELEQALRKISSFSPNAYQSNNDEFCELIEQKIMELL